VVVCWDFYRDTLWVFILFWITHGLKSYVANQTIIHRFISTRNERTAQRTVWSSALIGTAVSWLFLLLGTGLFLFYRQHPGRLDLTMDKPDAVFPWFIVFELPAGIVGLLIAALIAAAMSSLSGALNSTSTVMVTDFYRRFARQPSDAGAVRLGKILTASVGVFATGLALLLAQLSNKSLFDQTLSVVGLFGGGLGGLFLLGMVTTRTSGTGALVGLAVSAVVQFYVSRYTSLHLLTYMFTGMSTCIAAGYAYSLWAPERKDLTGLTVHTCDEISVP
jgi:SSS family solute:Na+ symporter